MKILVTGGAGFIGFHTVDLLLKKGHSVTIYDNFSTGSLKNIPLVGKFKTINGDISDIATIRCIMDRDDITHVLHLAAQVSVNQSLENPIVSAKENIIGFLNVLEAANYYNIKVVYASSAAAALRSSPYGLTKRIDEQYASLYRSLWNTKVIGLRYFNIYGPRQNPDSQYSSVITKFLKAAKDNSYKIFITGDGTQTRDFIHVDDIARTNLYTLTNFDKIIVGEVFDVGTGESVDLLRIVQIIENITGKRFEIEFKPEVAGDIKHSSIDKSRSIPGISNYIPIDSGISRMLMI